MSRARKPPKIVVAPTWLGSVDRPYVFKVTGETISSACGEEWVEARVYELKAISGKDSLRSLEFQSLFADIGAGRVNTILCTALDRICRSVKDFLHFFEVLNEYGVEFVCLKQNYDTTTPQGKLFVTIMMALAEFEREQTSEHTREATAARAERGLWNGGRLLGYDLDNDRKGYLIPNPEESVLVNFAFDSYLEMGSIKQTAEALNRRGYRTKAYTSRRGKHHPGRPFTITSVQYLLKNPAYIGKREVNKKAQARGKAGYRLVEAVWPPIVEEEKFEQVQRLAQSRSRSEAPNWLPGLVPQSVIRDVFLVRLPSLMRQIRKAAADRARQGRAQVAREWRALLNSSTIGNRAAMARKLGLSRARITQVVGPADASIC